MSDIVSRKEKCRHRLLEQRMSISASEFDSASTCIISKLQQRDEFQDASTVHCYVSMNERREVDTHGLIKTMLASSRQVIIPKTNIESGTLSHFRLTSFSDLQPNKWGVLEVDEGEKVQSSELDFVIVPMVAADKHGNRMGYGEGFYDRFLKDVGAPKVGLIFEQNVVDRLPVDTFDIPMDFVITEKRVIAR